MNTNLVALSGNLVSDPEVRQTKTGKTVAMFRIAVNERVKAQDGNYTDYANFFSCVQFGVSQNYLQYLRKGTKVALTGKLHYSEWEKDGQRRNKIEVYVNSLDFMESRQQQPPINNGYYAAPNVPSQNVAPQPEMSDQDIPF